MVYISYNQRRVDRCILHDFKNISREPIDYSIKSELMGLIKYLDSTPHKL